MMKWEEFTLSALRETKPTLSTREYLLVTGREDTSQIASIRRDQYALLGVMRLKIRLFQILEWRLGLDSQAVAEIVEVSASRLASQFGSLLDPINNTGKMMLDSEMFGNRMLGFLYAQYSIQRANRIVTEICKQLQLPSKITFETALRINHKAVVTVEHSEGYADPEAEYQITRNGITLVSGASQEEVEGKYLRQQFGVDLRELKRIPRYRRHHAPACWATWLLPNEFAEHWELEDQDAMDLMDDSPQHQRDRDILERIGELQLHSAFLA